MLINDAGDGINFDHGDYCDARFTYTGAPPKPIVGPDEEPVILTPKPGPAPRLNNVKRYGCRPGHPFLYRIPCQGDRPLRFSADGLPAGIQLDPGTGILSGTVPAKGEYRVVLHAENAAGKAERPFTIVAGDTLAPTPPMGWNDWYAHYDNVTDALMRQAADLMLSNGMADVGYAYVDIDDCWMTAEHHRDPQRQGPTRAADGTLLPNQHFPDMKALADYVHGRGLKAGLYTSPGPTTCAGFAGAWQHEAQDARTFADWGFDLLKYDWCSYGGVAGGNDLAAMQKPYRLMGELLKQQARDIQLNLCQYGMGNVWEWGAEVGGQSWRTAGDLGGELSRLFEVALHNCEHRAWNGPGAWNDPDYILVGNTGPAANPRPFGLTPNESYSFMSLWCLMASPLFYSGDMGSLDAFTLNVLCNPEVIELDQDPLGQCAAPAVLNAETFLLVKDLEDGSKAVGLFNRGEFPAEVTAPWAAIGVQGRRMVRDLWRGRELGVMEGSYTARVARHGVVLVKVAEAGP
ncbi:MAG: putative Ig domain-containing protein [Armatimonadetes bacterium]|nr:putative Ig domain-containing protein [Armatimonadota bacterium]